MHSVLTKIPKTACYFANNESQGNAVFQLSEDSSTVEGADKKKKQCLSILGYSGGVLNHYYWGRLVIDLAGMTFSKKTTPILMEHDRDRPLGYTSSKPRIDKHQLTIDDITLIENNDDVDEFVNNLSQGFPYQASIGFRPSRIRRLEEKEEVEVNGYTFKGPGTVVLASEYMEVSPCVFGVDKNTSSTLLSNSTDMYETFVEERMETKPEIDVDNDAMLALENKYKAELSAKNDELAQLKVALAEKSSDTAQAEENKALTVRLAQMEKQIAMGQEKAVRGEFDHMVKVNLSASGLPDRIQGKIAQMFSADNYIKQSADGPMLDTVALTAAITVELADWKDVVEKQPVVLGGGGANPKDNLASDTVSFSDEQLKSMAAAFGMDMVEA